MQSTGRLLFLGVLTLMALACFLTGNSLVDSSASAHVWHDIDADGTKDPEDTPTERIQVCATTDPKINNELEADYCYYTDHNGDVPSSDEVRGMFFPGAKCQDIYIFVVLPKGYDISTPRKVIDCEANFGLVTLSP